MFVLVFVCHKFDYRLVLIVREMYGPAKLAGLIQMFVHCCLPAATQVCPASYTPLSIVTPPRAGARLSGAMQAKSTVWLHQFVYISQLPIRFRDACVMGKQSRQTTY